MYHIPLRSLVLLSNDIIPERHKLIELKSRGGLKHPSLTLYNLICVLESATMVTKKNRGQCEHSSTDYRNIRRALSNTVCWL